MRIGRVIHVGKYKCELFFDDKSKQLSAAWSPKMPKTLTEAELDEYRAGRQLLLADVQQRLGLDGPILIAEV